MKFSIIVPCYNLERYIGEALDSVLAQTFADYECIVVDDGSTDNSPRIVDEYAARDSRIKVIHKPNGGEGSARNAGLDIAQGEWFIFLDGDDYLRNIALERLATAADRCEHADIIAATERWFDDGKTVGWPVVKDEEDYIVADIRQELFTPYGEFCVCGCSYKMAKFRDVRFDNFAIGTDRVYTAKCLARANTLVKIPSRFYAYRQRQASMANCAMTQRKLTDKIGYFAAMFKALCDSGKKLNAKYCRSRINLWMEELPYEIFNRLKRDDRTLAWKLWLQSLKQIPQIQVASKWSKMRAKIIGGTGSRLLACLFCIVPYRLKTRRFFG